MELNQTKEDYLPADGDLTMSDMAFARKMRKSCGLARSDTRSVLSSAGVEWHPEKIEKALLLMYADAQNAMLAVLTDGTARPQMWKHVEAYPGV